MDIRKDDPDIYFLPRRRNDARLKKGYWFLGNEHYVAVTFWSGSDTINKTANISFIVVPPKSKYLNMREGCTSFIQLTARDPTKKAKFVERMAKEIPGFEHFGKGEWNKKYKSINYMKNLESFLHNDKPLIDSFIINNEIGGIGLLKSASTKYIEAIEDIKNSRNQ